MRTDPVHLRSDADTRPPGARVEAWRAARGFSHDTIVQPDDRAGFRTGFDGHRLGALLLSDVRAVAHPAVRDADRLHRAVTRPKPVVAPRRPAYSGRRPRPAGLLASGGRAAGGLPSTGAMTDLYHHPLCPHSRFVRLILGEMGTEPDLIEERAFDRRRDFLVMNPAGTTPVLVEPPVGPVSGAGPISEYLDETRGPALGDRRLLPDSPAGRAEARRLVDWWNGKFFAEVSSHLITEKVYKRFMTVDQGGGAPDMDAVRVARANIRYHLRYVGFLIRGRNWLAGERLSYADLAAAAHLSAIDFLGDVPWAEDDTAKSWYARVKSRPSFRALLADRVLGIVPSPVYADLDF